MICFKDQTFCEYKECKQWEKCFRALTQIEKEKAKKWWGDKGEPPICIFSEQPDCFIEKINICNF